MIKYHLTKNHTTQLIALLAAALLTVGCTAEGEALAPDQGDELVEIIPTMTINGMNVSATRAATDDGEAFYFGRCDETGVGTGVFGSYPSTTENLLEATRSTAGALTFKTPQYYYTNGRKCRFIGFYPKETVMSVDYLVWEIDGTTDVLTATRLEGSKTDKGINTFNFKHRLTQLQFFPFAETADIAAQWGKITKIEILSQSDVVYWKYIGNGDASGELIYPGFMEMTVPGISAPFTLPIGSKASATVQAGASTMICPQTDPAYVLSLSITTEKLGVKTVTRTGALLENTPYRIYLRFTGQAIELAGFEQLNIEDWQEGLPKEVNSDRTYPYVVGGNTIVFQDDAGSAEIGSIHEPWTSNNMPYHCDFDWQWNSTPKKMEVGASTVHNSWNDEWSNHTKCPAPWRMPTLREACLILDYRDRLVGVDAITDNLLTGTYVKNPNSSAWYAILTPTGNGGWTKISKGSSYNIRCVKDIE